MSEQVERSRLSLPAIGSELDAPIGSRWRAWWERNRVALTEALIVFATARLLLSVFAVLAVAHLPEQSGLHYTFHRSADVWLDVWARWDSEYYLDVAQYGYAVRPALQAFFPLYPFLLSIGASLVGDYVLGGIVVSSLAAFVALVYLFKLAELEFGQEIASRAIFYVMAYPTAFFLLAVYSEPLFLAVTVIAFYYARRGNWALAAIAAFLAGMTRANGVVLVLPFAYQVWAQAGVDWRNIRGLFQSFKPAQWIAILAAPLGLLVWALYLGWLTNDPLALVHAQNRPPWERAFSLPWATLAHAVQTLGSADLSAVARAVNTLDLAAGLVLIEASIVAWWRLPRIYAIYLTASTVLLLSSTEPNWPMQSMARFSLVVFPLFFLLAQLGQSQHWHRVLLTVSLALLGVFTALFAQWYWMF